ncbi:MAG: DUF4133 domain-containing protein [Flavobacteriaceae bacterium]|nr:DUF4133 domain-containing protein [Flavobacteriaceae bacterium]
MDKNRDTEYEVYKGLQKPLVFKGVKGKFIYWMAGGVLGTFMATVLGNLLFGIGGATVIFAIGLAITFGSIYHFQKKGLYSKDNTKGKVFYKAIYKVKL